MFLTANSKIKRYLAEEAFWIVSIRSQIIKDQSRLAFFRLFQFEVATLTAPDDINEIFLLIESEKIKEVKSLSDAYPRIVYLTRWLANSDIDVKVSKIISAVSELWALSNWVGGQDQGLSIGADIPPMFPGVKRPFFQDLFSAAVIPRINSIEALRDFMDGLDNASEKDRSMLLDGFKTADGELRMVFNGPIISIKTSKQDQEQYANLLNEAIQKGRKWQHLFWIQAAMRARSVVLDEGLDRRKEAEKLIDAAIEEFGETNSLLDQRAIIYFNHKNYEKCLDIWRGILKRWDIDRAQKDLQPVFSSRCAAIAAARLGYLDEAAELFLSALERSQQFGRAVLTIGLQADYGYSLWKAGQKTKGANVIVEAFEALSSLPDRPNSYDEFAVRKLVSHIVMYLGSSDSILVEPQPGMCSNTAWDKTLLTLPRTPEDYCWMSIHSLAFRIGDRLLAEKASRICRFAKYAFVRFSTALLDLQETLISGPLEDAIKLGSLCAIEREKSEARPTSVTEVDPPGLTGSLTERTHTAFIQPAIICSLIRARATGSNVEKLIASWASSEEAAPVLIQKELSLVNELIACTVEELESIVTNNSSPTQRRAVASALLLGRTDTTPYGVAYAEVLLFSYATDNKLLHIAAEEAFSASIKKEWARFIEMPFRLRNPAVYVDAIREAIQTPHASWSYSARILLTALPTTTIKLSDSILSEMQAYHKEKKH
jgi:tetratricopeptide (TPR) repeat protein